jgi:hypothetical protein
MGDQSETGKGEARQCGQAGSRQAQLLIGASAIHFPAGLRNETERVSPHSVTISVAIGPNRSERELDVAG